MAKLSKTTRAQLKSLVSTVLPNVQCSVEVLIADLVQYSEVDALDQLRQLPLSQELHTRNLYTLTATTHNHHYFQDNSIQYGQVHS